MRPRPLVLVPLVLAILFFAHPARAQTPPWFTSAESSLEERFADGELDEEDLARIPAMPRVGAGSSDVHGSTWISLAAFTKEFPTGKRDIGGMLVIGLALDKITQGHEHAAMARPPLAALPYFAQSAAQVGPEPRLALEPGLARAAVRAAWRAVGIEATDARVDAMIARSEASAVLPEARLRATRTITGSDETTIVDATGHAYQTIGANLVLEARLTWRLDRLLYADDEPALERLRMDRQDARARLSTRVLELLFAWQRALIEVEATTAGTRAELDTILRRCESEVSLDVLTSGWFSAQPAVRTAARTRGKSP